MLGLVFSHIVESDSKMKEGIIKKVHETLRKSIGRPSDAGTPRPPPDSRPSPLPETSRSANGGGQQVPTSQKRHRPSPVGSGRNPVVVEDSDSDVEIVEVKRARNV